MEEGGGINSHPSHEPEVFNTSSGMSAAHSPLEGESHTEKQTANTNSRRKRGKRRSVFGVKKKPRKGAQVPRACTNCRKKRRKCDGLMPCSRCVSREIEDQCFIPELTHAERNATTGTGAVVASEASSDNRGKRNEDSDGSSVNPQTAYHIVPLEPYPSRGHNQTIQSPKENYREDRRSFRTALLRNHVNGCREQMQRCHSVCQLPFAAIEFHVGANGITHVVANNHAVDTFDLTESLVRAHIAHNCPILTEFSEGKWRRFLGVLDQVSRQTWSSDELRFLKTSVTERTNASCTIMVATEIITLETSEHGHVLKLGYLWPAEEPATRVQCDLSEISRGFDASLHGCLESWANGMTKNQINCDALNGLNKTVLQRFSGMQGTESVQIHRNTNGLDLTADSTSSTCFSCLFPLVGWMACLSAYPSTVRNLLESQSLSATSASKLVLFHPPTTKPTDIDEATTITYPSARTYDNSNEDVHAQYPAGSELLAHDNVDVDPFEDFQCVAEEPQVHQPSSSGLTQVRTGNGYNVSEDRRKDESYQTASEAQGIDPFDFWDF